MVTGKVILEAVILTAAVVVSLTLYTFWAARRGQDFNFLGPFLFGAIIVLMVFAMIQVSEQTICVLSHLLHNLYMWSFNAFLWWCWFVVAVTLSFGPDLCDDIWVLSGTHFLWVHRV